MPRPSALLLPLLLLIARAASAQTDPFIGTFASDRLAISIAHNGTAYSGNITMGEQVYPFVANMAANSLAGRFVAGTESYAFTAVVEGDVMTFQTGATTYRLNRAKANNPLDKPNPLDTPPPDKPPTRPVRPNPATRRVVIPPDVPAVLEATTSAKIDAAITRAKAYLWSRCRDGSWDLPARGPDPQADPEGRIKILDIMNASQWGGQSALATYALLAAGENSQDPKMAACIEFLKKADIIGTYALGVRALVWNQMPANRRGAFLDMAKRDRDLLLKNQRKDERWRGMFRYTATDPGYDHSASQFAVLGLWAAAQMGAEVPNAFWHDAEANWTQNQDASGGWNYGPLFRDRTPVTPSMTAAGVATLFITFDMLHGDAGVDCKGNQPHKAIDAGMKWMADNYEQVYTATWPFYTLYGVERIALASGYKYFGKTDWYKDGVAKLLQAQQANGSWGSLHDTCFALLFLARGRSPVLLNKLQYAMDLRGDKPREANWNQRPRDAANLCRWIGRQLERELNWQIVDLKGSADDLHDAPILYIAGNQALNLGPDQEDKLRTFVLQGGLIVGNADCGSLPFSNTFKRLGAKLFPPFEFRDLPLDHPIYHMMFPRSRWRSAPAVQGLSNGAREFMILLSAGDFARNWQTGAYAGREYTHELMANLYLYVSDKRDLRLRGDTWIVTPSPSIKPAQTIKLARLQFAGNWNPEPGGWQRLAAILHNEAQTKLEVETVKLGEGGLDAYRVAHLTSAGKFHLTPPQRAELKKFLASGGLLIADACGGNTDAAMSIESELSALGIATTMPTTNPAGATLDFLPRSHPAYQHLGIPADEISYRCPSARAGYGQLKGPRLRGAQTDHRLSILYSPEDISVALVGQPSEGVTGYTPKSAAALMRSVLLWQARSPKAE